MKKQIRMHYELHVQLYNANSRGEAELIQYTKSFRDENYIKARREALDHYYSWADVLLQGIGESYQSHTETCQKMEGYFKNPCGNPDLRTYIEVRCKLATPFPNWTINGKPFPKSFMIFCLNGNPLDASFFTQICNYEAPIYFDLLDRKLLVNEIKDRLDLRHFLSKLPMSEYEFKACFPQLAQKKKSEAK